MIKYTFAMIKPDAVRRNLIGFIISKIEVIGKIVDIRMVKLTKEIVKEFYQEHAERSFFNDMVNDITASEVVLLKIEGDESIVLKLRELMGSTDPKNAAFNTIRKAIGLSIGENSIHGSDSNTSADRELNIFFPK